MTIDTVVKIGGALAADPSQLSRVLALVGGAAAHRRLVVVPGGGPFADTVRDLDHRLQLPDDAAHWMAILAMDQYAHLLASRLDNAVLVEWPQDIVALQRTQIPIFAPSRWLRQADPLPHSWDVTSDSIAAWIAREMGAPHLVIVKRAGAVGPNLVDAHFTRVLSPHTSCDVISADQIDAIRTALHPATSS
jgi:5-(aminomethyl)-3-furanmethanol phosphate kinase